MADLLPVLIKEGLLTPQQAERAVKAARGGDVASAALELKFADEGSLVRAVARAHQCPGIDLSRSAIPVAWLDTVGGAQFCRDHRLVPVAVGRSELAVAMADPDDLASAEAVHFITGKEVRRYAAVGAAVVRALVGIERARAAGVSAWRGDRAPALPDLAMGHGAIVKASGPVVDAMDLPDADATMEIVSLADVMQSFGPPTLAGQPDPTSEAFASGKVALVAEDDPEVRQLIATALAQMGCVVLEAPDGKAALDIVRDARPDLVMLDAMMPGMHGFDVCRAIKGDPELRATRVVFCSAVYRGTVGADAQLAFGADAFIARPFRLEELARIVKLVLGGRAATETTEERTVREEATALWRQAAEALNQNQAESAAELARRATEKDPWSAEAHFYLGHALVKLGDLFDAIAAYERSAELRPDVDASYLCLAQAHEELGFRKSACEAWARAFETCKDPAKRKDIHARLIHLLGEE
ncbi:MAG TPA: response regulator [Anaeromyxobacteraceae bacterium]